VPVPTLHPVVAALGIVATITLMEGDAATQAAPSRTQVRDLSTRGRQPLSEFSLVTNLKAPSRDKCDLMPLAHSPASLKTVG
jgi:hypothetical protein